LISDVGFPISDLKFLNLLFADWKQPLYYNVIIKQ